MADLRPDDEQVESRQLDDEEVGEVAPRRPAGAPLVRS